MKILITGDKSYVGNSLERWLSQWPDSYSVDTVTLKNNDWKLKDFSIYNALFHVAAVVHRKSHPEMEDLYYRVNRDLAVEVALKAKQSGVKQFIFMSSMAVYGVEGELGRDVVIGNHTQCAPNTLYGKSKLEAEEELNKLNDEQFHVAIVRAPMIYGPDCPGNYARLKKLVLRVPVFPLLNNQRSMIFIDNLSEFMRLLLDNNDYGLFFPQNKEYVNTSKLVQLIAKGNSSRIYLSKILANGIHLFGKRIGLLNKIFGNLKYDMNLSEYKGFKYCVTEFEKSIEICESN